MTRLYYAVNLFWGTLGRHFCSKRQRRVSDNTPDVKHQHIDVITVVLNCETWKNIEI